MRQNYSVFHLKVYLQDICVLQLVSHEIVWVYGLQIHFNAQFQINEKVPVDSVGTYYFLSHQ